MRVAVERAEAVHRVLGEAPDRLAGALACRRRRRSASNSAHDMPSTHSVVSTRLVLVAGSTAGMAMNGWPAK